MTLLTIQQGTVVRLQGTLTEVLTGLKEQSLTNVVHWAEITATTDVVAVALRVRD